MATAATKPKIKIEPMVTVGVGYDSNFYETERDRRGVMTYTAQPGIGFTLETPKTKVLLNYTLEGYLYDDVSGRDHGDRSSSDKNYIGHLAAVGVQYLPTDRLTLRLDDSFYYTRYPYYYDRLSTTIEKRLYFINRLTPGIHYDFENRFQAGLRYRWTELNYEEHESSFDYGDSTEHRILLNLIYNPTRTTSLDLDYQIWWLNYHDDVYTYDEDYLSNQVRLIFEKRYKYFSFNVGGGYHHRDFQDPDAGDDGGTFSWKVSALGQNPPPPEGRRSLGDIFLRPRSQIYLAAEQNFSRFGPQFTGWRFTADMGHIFLDKIHFRLKGWYQISDYEDFKGFTSSGRIENRDDNTYDVSGSIAYLFTEKLALSFTAGRQERDSNLSGYSYENNYMILKIDFNYQFPGRGGYTDETLYY
jgi:hypothetical protein